MSATVQTAIIHFKTAAAVSLQAHQKLEKKTLSCFECDKQGAKYNGAALYASCTGEHHYVCADHQAKDVVCTVGVDRKSGAEVLKCNGDGCKSLAVFPPKKVHYRVHELNKSAHARGRARRRLCGRPRRPPPEAWPRDARSC